jgi:hypothetical protein
MYDLSRARLEVRAVLELDSETSGEEETDVCVRAALRVDLRAEVRRPPPARRVVDTLHRHLSNTDHVTTPHRPPAKPLPLVRGLERAPHARTAF